MPERGSRDLGAAAVVDDQAVGRRDQHVVVAAAGEVGSGDPPDDGAGGGLGPAGQRRTVGAVEGPDQSAGSGVGPFEHLHIAVAFDVTDGRAPGGGSPEVGPPHDAARGVGPEQGVGVGGSRVVGPGAEGDAGLAPAQEVAHGRRGVHGLVGVVLADQIATGPEHPQVPPGGVRLAVGHPGGRVAPLDHLGLPVSVEVGQRRGGEPAVGGEEGPPGQDRAGGSAEGVLVLAQRRGHHPGGPVEVSHGQRSLHPMEPVGVRGGPAPELGTGVGEGVVPPHPGIGGVAGPHEHGVGARPVRRDRRGRVDGGAARMGRPATDRAAVGQVERPQVAVTVADHHRRTASVQGGF